MPRRTRPLTLLFVYNLKARLDCLVAEASCAERATDAHQSVMLAAVGNLTVRFGLHRPSTLACREPLV
ncbi:MAG: hypothetical protein ABIZ80_13115, partial [Bryobacteraceae bacterium]